MPENKLQSDINADLRKLGWGFWHRSLNNSCGKKIRNKWKFDSKDKNEPLKTWPDLLIQPGFGYLFYVEVKDTNGQPTLEQLNFREWAISMGYHFYVVRSWQEWELVKKIELGLIGGMLPENTLGSK